MGKRTNKKNMAKKEKEPIPTVSNKLSEFEIHEISYNMQSMDLLNRALGISTNNKKNNI